MRSSARVVTFVERTIALRNQRIDIAATPASVDGWDICVISDAEIEPRTLNDWRGIANHLVVTKGRDGADLYSEGRSNPTHVPTFAADVDGAGNDSTGAGDVFAAAMLIRYATTNDARIRRPNTHRSARHCRPAARAGPRWKSRRRRCLNVLLRAETEWRGSDPW